MADKTVELKVNGEEIGMQPFVKNILSSTVEGFIKELNGCENAKTIEIKIVEE